MGSSGGLEAGRSPLDGRRAGKRARVSAPPKLPDLYDQRANAARAAQPDPSTSTESMRTPKREPGSVKTRREAVARGAQTAPAKAAHSLPSVAFDARYFFELDQESLVVEEASSPDCSPRSEQRSEEASFSAAKSRTSEAAAPQATCRVRAWLQASSRWGWGAWNVSATHPH